MLYFVWHLDIDSLPSYNANSVFLPTRILSDPNLSSLRSPTLRGSAPEPPLSSHRTMGRYSKTWDPETSQGPVLVVGDGWDREKEVAGCRRPHVLDSCLVCLCSQPMEARYKPVCSRRPCLPPGPF